MVVAPFGSWSSPIAASDLTAPDTVGLSETLLDGDDLYWLESRPAEAGRVVLCRRRDGRIEDVAPGHNVRSRVHEYGGGAYHVRDAVVAFSDFAGGAVWTLRSGVAAPLTPPGSPWRYGDLRVHPDLDLVLAVREDHSLPGEPVNTLVALNMSGDNADGGRVLCSGADFYVAPELSGDGRLAWIQWCHPDLPWDATRLCVAGLAGLLAGDGPAPTVIAGGSGVAVVSPQWLTDGSLVFASDVDGFWNLHRWRSDKTAQLTHGEHDLVPPPWVLGTRAVVQVAPGRLVCAPIVAGAATPASLSLETGELTDLGFGWADTRYLTGAGGRVAAVAGMPDRPAAVVVWDAATGERSVARRSSALELPDGLVSRAEGLTWTGSDGPVHGWFFPPANPDWSAPAGELPPLIVWCHGGPTALTTPEYVLGFQFWTSRGFAVAAVNYSGSSGFGRAYRERLRGRWGVADVADCIGGARALIGAGRVDPHRIAVFGSSAGGYTVLRALTAGEVFAAGVSRYGVGDLVALAQDTHKFESRYLEGLIGPWPEAEEVYRDRSPINHVDELAVPVLIEQGTEDRVVPPAQSELIAEALAAKGLPVELVMFPGEGHGFRRADSIQRAVGAELAFYGRVFGFSPA